MEELSALRRSGALAIGAIAWACVAVIGIGCFYSQQGWSPLLIAIAVSLIPTMIVGSGRTDTASRIALGLTLPLYPAILLYQWSGAAWQIDIHMIFFAAIATLVVLADWRPIIAGAGVTAVHHLLANLIMPTLVFPGGANLERVLLHAVIVIVETAALVWLSVRLEALILGQAASRAERDGLEASAAEERERTAAEQDLMIRSIGLGLNALSEGNLEYQISESFPSAYERLRHDFNQAGMRLCGMVRSVADAAACIHSGSSEIRVASDDLATRTERQAASLEETASAMREVTTMVQEAARNAAAVNTAIGEAHREADEGGQVVERAVVAMNAIERSSKEINDIINVIDGIAFQTNLLALNAGVEAARAGETGKGFAVVANEVRALAQRSADAARNIRELITTSTDQVDQGVSLVGETGRMLSRIVQRVGEISKLIGTISESTEIQAENLRQVNGAVGEMDKMTQQNAAMVEESTAASRSLAGEATELADLVSRFRTGGTPTVAVRQAPPPPKPAVARAAPVHGNLALKAEVDDADWQEF